MTDAEKSDIREIAFSTIILYLVDNVLRRVGSIENVSDLWTSLMSFICLNQLPTRYI